MAAPLPLPPFVRRRIETLAHGLLSPPGALPVDFTAPAGAPALVQADSVSWQVFKNPVTLFIGGVAAVLMELGEPRVRHGVWEHSNFRTEPLLRLQRTGLAAMVTVYGAADQAGEMIAGVTRMHARVRGTTPHGIFYNALDPDLLTWVGATAAFGFLQAYHRYARPLTPGDRDRYFAEAAIAARRYGAAQAPPTEAAWHALLDATRPALGPSGPLAEFLVIMRRVPALPRIGRPAQAMLIKAAVAALPAGLAAQLGIGPEWRLRAPERHLVRAMARTADRLVIRPWPAVQASRRLGLPDDYLYR